MQAQRHAPRSASAIRYYIGDVIAMARPHLGYRRATSTLRSLRQKREAFDFLTFAAAGLTRYETFVTRGAPTAEVFKTTGQGLELVPITHPADVIAGETSSFRFLPHGKPAAGLDVAFKRGCDVWKPKPTQLDLKAGPNGDLNVTLPES